MERAGRKQKAEMHAAHELEDLHHALLALYDELTETTALTALVLDGACGILGEPPTDTDSATYTGMRFAASWLKRRNQSHASSLKAACNRLREIRGG